MFDNRIKIGITQGDINGIGWEVIIKMISSPTITEIFTPVIYGTRSVAKIHYNRLKDIEPFQINYCSKVAEVQVGKINFISCGADNPQVEFGKCTIESANAAIASLDSATADLLNGNIDAIVTAPINKEAMHMAGFEYTGHTEYFAAKASGNPMMIMCGERLRVALQTIHIPLDKVACSLTTEGIVSSLKTLRTTLKTDFGVVEPRIAVLSLNPHCGDGGLLGNEEQTIIKPAVCAAMEEGIYAFGPLSADGLFASGAYTKYDAILAMYHDQGLTPFKTIQVDGVNFTAGLNIIRTSPDHGVAFDIAGKDMASADSMRNAVYAAIDIVRSRDRYKQFSAKPLEHFERETGRDISIKDLPQVEESDLDL